MTFEIVSWDEKYAGDFRDITLAWLEKYFTVEPVHRQALENPDETILKGGGEIFFALQGERVVGTVALRRDNGDTWELTKLGVLEGIQGAGLGRALCEAVIDAFKERGGKLLYLETHSKLSAALGLYEKLGFQLKSPDGDMNYAGCDLYMQWQDSKE